MAVNRNAKAIEYLQKAIELLEGEEENPEWFRETGHLSDKGIAHLHALFARGKSTYAAAKEMGISYRATSLRHVHWRKKHAKS
jgi:hypothetical protein